MQQIELSDRRYETGWPWWSRTNYK